MIAPIASPRIRKKPALYGTRSLAPPVVHNQNFRGLPPCAGGEMKNRLYDKMDELWKSLVAAVCEELREGTLEFSDAIDDLLFLGFKIDEAYEKLQAVTVPRPQVH